MSNSAFFISQMEIVKGETGAPTLGIWVEGRLAGVAGFHALDRANKRGSVGYWMGLEFTGRGWMTQSVRALIQHGFDHLELERIEIRSAEGNLPSRRLAERLGFTREGCLRRAEWLYDHWENHELFSVLREEWGRGQTLGPLTPRRARRAEA